MSENRFRQLPAVSRLLELPPLVEARSRHPHEAIAAAARAAVDVLRARLAAGESPDLEPAIVAAEIASNLDRAAMPALVPVINATGVVLHTNLGRSPLHESAVRAAYEASRGYINLELDLNTGKRSSRQDAVRAGLCALTGAEAATAVNNNAAATLLVLKAMAAGREVIVSRGQLIEIGGGFRLPEVMAASGAVLREVGTTNITRANDYERAIGPAVAALLRVHTSNFRVRGFTRSVSLSELVELGRKHNLPVIDDIGSGLAVDLTSHGLPDEPIAADSVAAGADLVLFSGDKLLGGPQAGLIVGRAELIRRIEADPLMRAIRLDKMTLAALEATLRIYRDPDRALREIPTLRMLTTPLADLRARAERFAVGLRAMAPQARVEVREDVAYVGGGSLPDVAVPTAVVAISAPGVSESELAARLRTGRPPVIGRNKDGQVFLDLRTVFHEQESDLTAAILSAVSSVGRG